MADGAASAVVDASPAAPSDGELEAKTPANAEARAKEALRAKRRRLESKLKSAKSEHELREHMRKFLGADAPAEGEAVGLAPLQPTEPGQRPGWPPPSKVDETRLMLVGAIQGTAEVVETMLGAGDADEDDAVVAARTVVACLKAEPGAQLAEAWAPLVALYAPAWMNTPHAAAAFGTLQAGGIILASVKATLDRRDEERAAAKKAKEEPKP